MSTPSIVAGSSGPDQRSNSGTVIVEWPAQRVALGELEQSKVPRLVVVDDGSEPPISADCCQDWMWRSGGEREMRLRLQHLALRACEHGHGCLELDDLGMLRLGLRSIHLPAKERALAALLIRNFGEAVAREELIATAWPDGVSRPNVLTSRISKLRSRLRWLGLQINGVNATGYCLTAATSAPDVDTGGFEEELATPLGRRLLQSSTSP